MGGGGVGGGGGAGAAALPVVPDGDSGQTAADVLFGFLRAPVEAAVGSGVSAGSGVAARQGGLRVVWDRYSGGIRGIETQSGTGKGGVAGGLGDAVGHSAKVVVGCRPCKAGGGGWRGVRPG